MIGPRSSTADDSGSAADRVGAFRRRAEAIDPVLGCFVRTFPDEAAAAARRRDQADRQGPAHGVVVAVKDLIATRECPTTAQSRVYDPDWFSGADAAAIDRLRSAGAVIIGKTSMAEHGIGRPAGDGVGPVPRNPWEPRYWTGGSSSGAAAGTSAGLFDIAIGTDTNGSIRIPAAFCGVTGLKPTIGRVPLTGCLPLAPSLDTIGSMARSARECLRALAILAGQAPESNPGVPGQDLAGSWRDDLTGVRIAIAQGAADLAVPEVECQAAFAQALEDLAGLGATLVPIRLTQLRVLAAAQLLILGYEGFRTHRLRLRSRWAEYGRSFRRTIAVGCVLDQNTYRLAQRARTECTRSLRRDLSSVAVLATPTWPGAAPRFDDPVAMARTSPWPGVANTTGFPAMALPMGFSRTGLPLSMQFMGLPGDESRLAAIADVYQQHTGWHRSQPDLDRLQHPDGPLPMPIGSAGGDEFGVPGRTFCARMRQSGLQPDRADLADMGAIWSQVSGLVDLVRGTAR